MNSQMSRCLLWVLCASCFFSSSAAYTFYVGGKDGWVLSPHENYNHWAGRNRFQVNDTLVFYYKKGSDSVLLVDKEDYTNCNTKKPLQIMNSGSSVFKFNQSGPFYFISGQEGHCKQGQKLTVVVLAVRSEHSPPYTPSPGHRPPAPPSGAGSPSQTPEASPNHPSPSPQSPPAATPKYPSTPGKSPEGAPPAYAKTPSSLAPVPSHGAHTPRSSPTPAKAPSSMTFPPTPASSPSLPSSPNYTPFPPALSPKAPSSTPSSPSPATSPSSKPAPSAHSPGSPPTSAEPPPADTPNSSPGSLTPPGSGSQNVNSSAPSASWGVTPSNVMWILGSILVCSIIEGVHT